jgi:hypothetical protein
MDTGQRDDSGSNLPVPRRRDLRLPLPSTETSADKKSREDSFSRRGLLQWTVPAILLTMVPTRVLGQTHNDANHLDRAHADHTDSVVHQDTAHSDHADHDDSPSHSDYPHSDHSDVHSDYAHVDHEDAGSFADIAHFDHSDAVNPPHFDSAHVDSSHGDTPHSDGSHTDQQNPVHNDSPHGDITIPG